MSTRNFFKNLRLLPRNLLLFISAAVCLLALSMVQVNCPICSTVTIGSLGNSLGNVKVLEVKGEFIDYNIDHEWCRVAYASSRWKVYISLANEGSESLVTPILIEGKIPLEVLDKYNSTIEKSVKLVLIEIPGKEIKEIEESAYVMVISHHIYEDLIYQTEFSATVITNPEELRASCPVCGGTGKVLFVEWLKVKFQ